MLKLAKLILIMALVNQCQSFCGEDENPTKVPAVTVTNSTHLHVSWNGLFTGCTSYDVGRMVSVVEHKTQNTDTSKTYILDFEEKEGLLPLNPCLQYKIYLRLFSYSYNSDRYSSYNTYRDSNRVIQDLPSPTCI